MSGQVNEHVSEERGRAAVRYHRALVSTVRVDVSFAPIGSNLPDFDNYFCRDCRRIVHVRKGSPGFRACPTPGCVRPTGFGVFATVPRPRTAVRTPTP